MGASAHFLNRQQGKHKSTAPVGGVAERKCYYTPGSGLGSGPPATNYWKEEDMLLDVRTYTCRPGTIKKHLALYERMGKGPQTRHLGEPFAYLVTETGNVNQYMHIWAYEDAADRERRRAAMWTDPDWIAYTEESAKLGALEAQENRLMQPVSFFPVKR